MLLLLVVAGCQQKMADQPSYKPLEPSDFFADGRSERPLVPGTVARGHLQTDVALHVGRKSRSTGQLRLQPAAATTEAARAGVSTLRDPQPGGNENAEKPRLQPKTPDAKSTDEDPYADFVTEFPIPMTEKVLQHGYHRYMIYCVVCHDSLGTGQGKMVERGYTPPPSFHIERLRKAPVGHLFAVMTEGYGSMPSYGPQIPLGDRWAITGYLRALQTSQHFPESEVTEEMRKERSRQTKAPVSNEGRSP